MSYATSADLSALDLPAAATEGMTAADIDLHLEAASARIDGYLRGRYLLPLSSPYPAEIVACTTALAAYSVLSRRGFDPHAGTDANVRVRYEDAISWLERIAQGKVNLAALSDASPSVQDGGPRVRSGGPFGSFSPSACGTCGPWPPRDCRGV